jgi:hypothetical protein
MNVTKMLKHLLTDNHFKTVLKTISFYGYFIGDELVQHTDKNGKDIDTYFLGYDVYREKCCT